MARTRDQKLRELILYIAARCEGDERFGAMKLNKILFFSDFLAYGQLGSSITGDEYQRLEKGPAPRRLVPVRNRMEQKGECAVAERDYLGHVQKRLIALRDPDLSIFSGDEIAIVDSVIERMRSMTGTQASDLSHRFIGWQAADDGETIPYESAFLTRRPLTDEEEEWAARLRSRRVES